jgi:hypothetical protein
MRIQSKFCPIGLFRTQLFASLTKESASGVFGNSETIQKIALRKVVGASAPIPFIGRPRILVKDPDLLQELRREVPEVIWTQAQSIEYGHLPKFIRDHAIRLHDGSMYCHPLFNEEGHRWITASLIACAPCEHEAWDIRNIHAFRIVQDAGSFCKVLSSYFNSKKITVTGKYALVEGGNALISWNRDREPAAIIGLNSLFKTLTRIRHESFYKQTQEELLHRLKKWKEDYAEPSARAFQMAYNWEKLIATDTIDDLAGNLCHNIPDEAERKLLWEKAFEFDVQLNWSAEIIAEEIKVPRERVAYVSQVQAHIDFSMTTDNRGNVFVDCDPDDRRACSLFQVIKRQLEEKKFNVIPVRGYFSKSNSDSNGRQKIVLANFMNGLFIPRVGRPPLYITTAASDKSSDLEAVFQTTMQPYAEVKFCVNGLGWGPDSLRHRLNNIGGVHCCTLELPLWTKIVLNSKKY